MSHEKRRKNTVKQEIAFWTAVLAFSAGLVLMFLGLASAAAHEPTPGYFGPTMVILALVCGWAFVVMYRGDSSEDKPVDHVINLGDKPDLPTVIVGEPVRTEPKAEAAPVTPAPKLPVVVVDTVIAPVPTADSLVLTVDEQEPVKAAPPPPLPTASQLFAAKDAAAKRGLVVDPTVEYDDDGKAVETLSAEPQAPSEAAVKKAQEMLSVQSPQNKS